jgi:transcriptional regulator with XRE-family HTH domain
MADLPMPLPVARALAKLAGDLSRARRRRRFSQASLAERSGVSVATVRRMERGDLAGMRIEHLARVIYVLGEIGRLDRLLDAGDDAVGLMLMDEELPKRVRSRRGSGAL